MLWDFFVGYLFSPRAGAVLRRIAWISLLAVMISVGALILVMSVMRALNQSIEDRTLAVDPHLVVTVPSAMSIQELEVQPIVSKAKSREDWISHLVESQDVIVRTMEGRFRGATLRGMSEEGLRYLFKEIDRVQKRNTDPEAANLAETEVIIGVDLAHTLGVFEGDSLILTPPEGLLLPLGERPPLARVTVKKILATNLPDVDSQTLFVRSDLPMRALAKAMSKKLEVHIWTAFPHRAEENRMELVGLNDAKVETWKERNSALFYALKLEKAVIGLFLTLASLVAGFSLFSVIGLLISQKKVDIGVLQAMGMSQKQVSDLFLKMGLLLAGISLGAGLFLGSSLSLYLEAYPLKVLPDIYYDSDIPAQLEVSFVVMVGLIGLGLSYLGMRLGTRSVMQMTPTQCLKK